MKIRRVIKNFINAPTVTFYDIMVHNKSSKYLSPISFKAQDHFPHTSSHVEWWYFTGILTTANRALPIGFEVTFFRVKTLFDSVIVHSAITDTERGNFYCTGEILPVRVPSFNKQRIISVVNPLRMSVDNELSFDEKTNCFTIRTFLKNLQMNLKLSASNMMAQGDNGVIQMANYPDDSAYYFAFPDLKTEGEIVFRGEPLSVKGLTWHDHQWGNFNITGLKWDWFSLRLDEEGLYIMLFNFDRRGTRIIYGNIHKDLKNLQLDEVKITANGSLKANDGTIYTFDWDVEISEKGVPIMKFHVKPVLKEQFIPSLVTPDYWEGLCTLSGEILTDINYRGIVLKKHALNGFAYVELAGYE